MEDDNIDSDSKIANAESASLVSSTIMLKVPTSRLLALRKEFEDAGEDGVNMVQFLLAFVKHMSLESTQSLLKILPDLVDFFNLVDVNGDGHMEWSEFVMFVIEQVVQDTSIAICEKFSLVNEMAIQESASRTHVTACKYIKEFNKLFVGIDGKLSIFSPDPRIPTWLDLNLSIPMKNRTGNNPEAIVATGKGMDVKLTMNVIDMVFIDSKELLCVLRSDLRIDFFRFMSRSKLLPETISCTSTFPLLQSSTKIQVHHDKINNKYILFTIGSINKFIECWDMEISYGGEVELTNYKTMRKHTDIVKDILVISSDTYNILVSCGMDAKVYLWDLETLQYKVNRSGFISGVQCLAYDGKSVLLAGGFDHTIIAWDLDAELDRPLFNLWGHNSPICKIVCLDYCNRCFTLDADGIIKLWDVSKENPNDKELRLLAQTSCLEDHLRAFDVIPSLAGQYDTMHKLMVVSSARKQHIYRLEDYALCESPPIKVLYSKNLLLVVSIHMKDILFWSAITGDEQMKMENVGNKGPGCECSCAVLDDRLRKLIVGNSEGEIVVYNCISGVKLKQFQTVPFAIRNLIYTPDKTVIALAGPGDIYIYDELPNDADSIFNLRDTRAHEVDVTAIAYSHTLGLIATIDCVGTLKLFNYEYIQLDTIIENYFGPDVGQLEFIEPFPLLIVSDTSGNFTIIPVGYAQRAYGRKLWHIETQLIRQIVKVDKGVTITFSSVTSNSRPTSTNLRDSDEDDEVKETENNNILEPDNAIDNSNELKLVDEKDSDDDDDDDEEIQHKPFSPRKMESYLLERRQAKCMKVYIRGIDNSGENVTEDLPAMAIKVYNKMKEDALKKQMFEAGIDVVDESDNSDIDEPDEMNKTKIDISKYNNKANLPDYPTNVYAYIICGNDDGTVCMTDITPALKEINIGIMPDELKASKSPHYNPRRIFQRVIRDSEIDRSLWSKNDISSGEIHVKSRLVRVWHGARSAINTLSFIGDYDDILLASDDGSVSLFTLQGYQKGVLTRGRKFDKMFKPRWVCPINMKKRGNERKEMAVRLMDGLELQIDSTIQDDDDEISLSGSIKSSIRHESTSIGHESSAKHESYMHRNSINQSKSNSHLLNDGVDDKSLASMSTNKSNDNNSKGSKDHSRNSKTKFKEPETTRVLGQLAGKITYIMSSRDITAQEMKAKQTKALNDILSIDSSNSRKSTDDNGDQYSISNQKRANNLSDPFSSAKYMSDLMSSSTKTIIKKEEPVSSLFKKRERKIATRFDMEIAKIDAEDPHNWEIQSMNRQRALYAHLYKEFDKAGITKDKMAIYIHKLNSVSPGNDFMAFVKLIKSERIAAKKEIDNLTSINTTITKVDGLNNSVVDTKLIPAPMYAPPLEVDVAGKLSSLTLPPSPAQLSPLKQTNLKLSMSSPSLIQSPKRYLTVKEMEEEEKRLLNLQYIEQSVEKFEKSIKQVEVTFKKAKKAIRRIKKEQKKRDIEDRENARLNNPFLHDDNLSLGSISMNDTTQNSISTDKTFVNPRRMYAQLLLSKSASMSEMLEIGEKQEYVDKNIQRKIDMTISKDFMCSRDIKIQAPKNRVPLHIGKNSSIKEINDSPKHISDSINKASMLEQIPLSPPSTSGASRPVTRDEKLLSRTHFGVYEADELLKFFRTWESLPLLNILEEEIEDEIIVPVVVKNDDDDDDEDIDWDDMSAKPPPKPIELPKPKEKRLLTIPIEKELISLDAILNTSYIRARPNFKLMLEKLLKRKMENYNIDKSSVNVTLKECIKEMIPTLNDIDRKSLIRYFELNKIRFTGPNSSIKEERELTVDEIKQLKAMFIFFDSDKSGTVDRDEIRNVLKNTVKNQNIKAKSILGDSDGMNELDAESHAMSTIDTMIDSVDNDGDHQLDFNEFCLLFKSIFL